jgi:aminoglycoside 6'-N-acetyltransferase I
MKIVKATRTRLEEWVNLRLALWPDEGPRSELKREAERMMRSRRAAVFLAADDKGAIAGFAEFGTREYANGCRASPVGFLEGIYVRPEFRRKGVAAQLVSKGEEWARSRGYREMGSDTYIDNRQSILFHQAMGFRIKERLIAFCKKLTR